MSLLFSIASAIALYKSISKLFLSISFCSLISDIFLISSLADISKVSIASGSGDLEEQEVKAINNTINVVFIKLLSILKY